MGLGLTVVASEVAHPGRIRQGWVPTRLDVVPRGFILELPCVSLEVEAVPVPIPWARGPFASQSRHSFGSHLMPKLGPSSHMSALIPLKEPGWLGPSGVLRRTHWAQSWRRAEQAKVVRMGGYPLNLFLVPENRGKSR